ncbi:MAG: hypothetical protein ACI8X3_002204, partial [Saprospiraceae bacterium]
MKLSERINVLAYLGAYLKKGNELLDAAIELTYFHNRWFIIENTQKAIEAISTAFLQKEVLEKWVSDYDIPEKNTAKKVGLILAGNIPLVGFHDIMSVFVAGHIAKIKLSEKDKHLMPHFIKVMAEVDDRVNTYFEITERLLGFDAVIATGSNNSARYFDAYFGKYPNIIRKNRNAVAVLTGKETPEDFKALGIDIFQYFGLGCRNVSKIYVPEAYDFDPLLEALHEYNEIVLNDKYKNNFDYNYTLLILNSVAHKSNGCILMTEGQPLQSRIAQLHYEYYKDENDLKSKLDSVKEEIQCIVSNPMDGLPV